MLKNLSKEQLLIIFKELKTSDIKQCQIVCRAWYHPARISLLNQVQFNKLSAINDFIESIDRDPQPSYLAAVKKIRFRFSYYCEEPKEYSPKESYVNDREPDHYKPLDKQMLKRLFFRFPNLESVRFADCLTLFANFDDQELCAEFLKSCPRLEVFEIDTDYCNYRQNYTLIYNLRHLLTTMVIEGNPEYTMPPEFESVQHYISKFPRLDSIHCNNKDIQSFEEFLPLFDQLSNITRISLRADKDKVDFAEKYFDSKTEEEEDQLVEKLSKVKFLDLKFRKNFCVNSIKFVYNYLIGLESFHYHSSFNGHYNDLQEKAFREDIMGILGSVEEGHIYINYLKYGVLQRSLPTILDKILFDQVTQAHLEMAEQFKNLRCSNNTYCSFTYYVDDEFNITVGGSKEYTFKIYPDFE